MFLCGYRLNWKSHFLKMSYFSDDHFSTHTHTPDCPVSFLSIFPKCFYTGGLIYRTLYSEKTWQHWIAVFYDLWSDTKIDPKLPSVKTFDSNMSAKWNKNFIFLKCMNMSTDLLKQCLICIFNIISENF